MAAADQLEHLLLATGQLRPLVAAYFDERVDEPGGDFGVDHGLSGVGEPDGAREVLGLDVLEQVARGAGAERGQEPLVVEEAREHDHPSGGNLLVQLAHRLDAVEPRHHEIHHSERGISLIRANNDRQAGYVRLLELLHVKPGRIPPRWAQVPESLNSAPRLYVFSTCKELIRQLKSAPVAVDGQDAGEAVDKHRESEHGHAVASLRYGAMSRPSRSEAAAEKPPDNPAWDDAQRMRAEYIWKLERKREQDLANPGLSWEFV